MDHELLGRLQRLREAHAVLAAELSAAKRELHDARKEVAGLRAQIARQRQQPFGRKPVRIPIESRGW